MQTNIEFPPTEKKPPTAVLIQNIGILLLDSLHIALTGALFVFSQLSF